MAIHAVEAFDLFCFKEGQGGAISKEDDGERH